jgi:hypothetical protein
MENTPNLTEAQKEKCLLQGCIRRKTIALLHVEQVANKNIYLKDLANQKRDWNKTGTDKKLKSFGFWKEQVCIS